MFKNVLIDCGTHLGEGLKKHILSENINKDWEIYSFEANIHTYELLKKIRERKIIKNKYEWLHWDNIHFYNKAVWIKNTMLEFYCASITKCEFLKDNDYFDFLSYHNKLLSDGDLLISHHRYDILIDGSSTIFPHHFAKSLVDETIVQRNIEWAEDDKILVEAIDFSDFLQRTVSKKDYVVCKMDIEGAEFPVLEKMIEDGTLFLIDKIIIEFHNFGDNELSKKRDKIMNIIEENKIKFVQWE